jgi:hypothetical protein
MAASQERPGDEANDVVMFSHFLIPLHGDYDSLSEGSG